MGENKLKCCQRHNTNPRQGWLNARALSTNTHKDTHTKTHTHTHRMCNGWMRPLCLLFPDVIVKSREEMRSCSMWSKSVMRTSFLRVHALSKLWQPRMWWSSCWALDKYSGHGSENRALKCSLIPLPQSTTCPDGTDSDLGKDVCVTASRV